MYLETFQLIHLTIFFLLISEKSLIRLDNEASIDFMLSINSFSGSFLLISDKSLIRLDSEADIDSCCQ